MCEEYPDQECEEVPTIKMVEVVKTVWVKQLQKDCNKFWSTDPNTNAKLWVEDPNNCEEILTEVPKNITQIEPRATTTTNCVNVSRTRTNTTVRKICEEVYKSDCTKTVPITTCIDVKETECEDFGAEVNKVDCFTIHEKIPKTVQEVRAITVCA